MMRFMKGDVMVRRTEDKIKAALLVLCGLAWGFVIMTFLGCDDAYYQPAKGGVICPVAVHPDDFVSPDGEADGASSDDAGEDGESDDGGEGQDDSTEEDVSCDVNKTYVCHNEHTICISDNAVEAHTGHGDDVGRCLSESDF